MVTAKPQEVRACCYALTASCLACSAGKTEEEYCRDFPNTVGCPTGIWTFICSLILKECKTTRSNVIVYSYSNVLH